MRTSYIKRVEYGPSGKLLFKILRAYDGPWALAGMAVADQTGYGFYDDGTESGSNLIGSQDAQQTLDVNINLQCRIEVTETGGASTNINGQSFEYNHNGGGWGNLITTTSSVVKAVNSANLTDGNDTTQRLGGGGTYDTTNAWICETGMLANNALLDYNLVEGLLSFQIVGPDVSHGDEILIRIEGLDAYTVPAADIDVNKPTAARRVIVIS